jgi:mannose-6-phosphate isomerase
MWYPLTFRPIYQDRVWGGRRLETLFGRALPEGRVIGESWEVCDRPDAVSVVANGPLAGRSLRSLMTEDAAGLWGPGVPDGTPFPWLCKLLDACDDLSLQVHPPAGLAASMGGEPKTEMWYVAAADPGACVYAGVQPGTTREVFAQRAQDGTVAELFHRIPVAAGDVLFLPSGRVHALGRGLVIFEIQQNSDTTYRVFDWNRVGLDGKPRALHLEQALASIDFTDTDPTLVPRASTADRGDVVRPLVRHGLFAIDEVRGRGAVTDRRPEGGVGLVAVVSGSVRFTGGGQAVTVGPGGFVVLPAAMRDLGTDAGAGAVWLQVSRG